MQGGFLIFVIAVVVVGLFILGMSLTLILKGHHIDSEIGENKNMRARGIKCTAQQFREEERALREGGDPGLCGRDQGGEGCNAAGCDSCGNRGSAAGA